jgi:protein TonB
MISGNYLPITFEDIIFEGRNKSYGAYAIRKNSTNYLEKGLVIAIALALLIIFIPVILQSYTRKNVTDSPIIPMGPNILTDVPPPPTIPIVPLIQVSSTAALPFVPPHIVDKPLNELPIHSNVELGKAPGISSTAMTGNEGADAGPATDIAPLQKPEEPLTFVDQPPSFPGGDEALHSFLASNIHYTGNARDFNIQGKVYVQFVVEKDGNISNLLIKKDIGAGCGEEAVRVIKMLPPWLPGRQNGHAVRTYVVLPIRFELK